MHSCEQETSVSRFSALYGNCYTLNTEKFTFLTSTVTQFGGLTLDLNLEVDKYGKFTETTGV